MQSNTTTALTALAIPVFNGHNPVREVTLIHIEVQTVHCNQLGKSDVICLFVLVCHMVTEHEATFLACMRMEVDVH